jgi:hypothetical protein
VILHEAGHVSGGEDFGLLGLSRLSGIPMRKINKLGIWGAFKEIKGL